MLAGQLQKKMENTGVVIVERGRVLSVFGR